jgi:hypothetical protein
MIQEYQNRHSIIHQEDGDILARRDGKLKPVQKDFLCPEVKM